MQGSKEQKKLLNEMKKFCVGTLKENYRPDFLKNCKTGKNYEIDIFVNDLEICVEYQGMVHFKNITKYKNDSDKSRYNDMSKSDLCDRNPKYPIIEIFPSDLNGNIKDNFMSRLLKSQEYYFNNRHFRKCRQLERFYLSINKNTCTVTGTYLDLCHKIKNYKKYGNRRVLIGNLLVIRKKIDDNRVIFNVDKLSKLLSFDFYLEILKRKKEDRAKLQLTSKN